MRCGFGRFLSRPPDQHVIRRRAAPLAAMTAAIGRPVPSFNAPVAAPLNAASPNCTMPASAEAVPAASGKQLRALASAFPPRNGARSGAVAMTSIIGESIRAPCSRPCTSRTMARAIKGQAVDELARAEAEKRMS
jgi:hypothetical protein